jgi:hypothetical protein
VEGRSRSLILRNSPGIFLERLRKTTKTLGQGSRSPGRNMKELLPEYEAGVLINQPRRSVVFIMRITQNTQINIHSY